MQLALEHVSKKVAAEDWLYDMSLSPRPGEVTVLLGATQAGKTSLMRIMARLNVLTNGQVVVDGLDVTGMPVRDRNVAMVYKRFINYPSLNVFDNIASPLKLRGDKNLTQTVYNLAERLHIEMFLDRLPAELSGGHPLARQCRVAVPGGATNSPAAIYALTKYIDWMKKYAPKEAMGMTFGESGPVPAQGQITQKIFWYTAFTADMVKPGLPVVNADGTPKWRMVPGPNGPYWILKISRF